jgi:hypothetical protein
MQKHQRPVCNKGRVATDACLDFPPRPRARTRSALSLALAVTNAGCSIATLARSQNVLSKKTKKCGRAPVPDPLVKLDGAHRGLRIEVGHRVAEVESRHCDRRSSRRGQKA